MSRRSPPRLSPLQLQGLRAAARGDSAVYPFSVPTVGSLDAMEFTTPVTFFVGENGSGKSTILECIAAAARLPTVGPEASESARDADQARALASAFRFSWGARTHRGFFLRAEDFFGFVHHLAALRAEMQQRLHDVDAEYVDRSPLARKLAAVPARASLAEIERRYGVDFAANSHGEQFLELFRSRLVPGGLYLMDEPEAALSPQSQLGLIAMIMDMVRQGAQFIIATHSPIVLAFPGATIMSFDAPPPRTVSYESLAHVALTRDFLNDPERYLRRLAPDDA